MEMWQKFANDRLELRELLDVYLEIRLYFKELGYTQEDLKSIRTAPNKLWSLKSILDRKQDDLLRKIYDYGFEIDFSKFSDFLREKYKKIDELTPLDNGDNKRTDSWDEDIE
jgi:hypothetical protein